ncbi:BadF/BadG/BcrA/BcrD ATPase family protein [Clostridium polynesiense]|uniref:BadF/BadG/BcrA/BcrD ATPase family protein n=1 Tax=Clostridium polynesiense TaxID=1325933 RepID=UPI0005907195|nr:BadF/BadG/BcrA/BcrD ATPase family protein [Clostridium polynesiense]
MKYIVGIDGGGTKTKLIVMDTEEKVQFSCIGGPCNILSSGYDTVKQSIEMVLQEGIIDNGLSFDDCIGMCIGAAGGARDSVKSQLEEIVRNLGYKGNLQITHDGEISLIAGSRGEAALLLIAGTGAICYGRNKQGDAVRVSGWGHIIGDEGSAYSLGIKIVKAVMKAYDGRGEKTALKELLFKVLQINSEEEVIMKIYGEQSNKEHIAALAVLIEDGLKLKDAVSIKIADETIDELVYTVLPAAKKLGFMDSGESFKVIIDGSVLVNNDYIREGFTKKIQSIFKNACVSITGQDAASGAAIKILKGI